MLQTGQAPAGTQYLAAASGPQSRQQLVKGDKGAAKEIGLLTQDGFRDAHLSLFAGARLTPVAAAQSSNEVASEAQRYRDVAGAQRAYLLFSARGKRLLGGRAVVIPTSGLGSDSSAFRYVLHPSAGSTGDLIGYAYIWRQGTLVLSLFAFGDSTFATTAATGRLARTMVANAGG